MKEREQTLKTPKTLIAGYGIVGKNLHKDFPFCQIYDPILKETEGNKNKHWEIVFVCVPTPFDFKKKGACDISIVKKVINDISSDVYVIKSTIPPTTTEKLKKKYGKRIIFSPEYNGATIQSNVAQNFVILGGDKDDCRIVRDLYYLCSSGNMKYYIVDSTTAELTKYMENCYLATKVVFCNEFALLAQKLGIDYGDLRECFVADSRVNPSHTYVYRDYPFYDSKCLNKDLPAIVKFAEENGVCMSLIRQVIDTNKDMQKKKGYINEFFSY